MANFVRLPSGEVLNLDHVISIRERGERNEVRDWGIDVELTSGVVTCDDEDVHVLRAWAASHPALGVGLQPATATADEGPFKVGERVSFEYVRGDGDRVGVVRFIDPEDESLFVCVPGRRGPSQAEGVRGTGWWMMPWEFDRVDKVTP